MTTPDRAPPSPPPPPAAVPAPAPAPKKRRWKKILLLGGGTLLGLLLIVVIVGPSVIGSIAKSKISSILGEKLQANVTVGSVTVRWSGHVELEDFRLVPKNFSDPLIDVKKVDVKVDVGAAIGGRYIAD